MPEPRIAVEAFGARLLRLVNRAKQAQVDAEVAQGRARRFRETVNAATPGVEKPFAVELENEVPLQ